MSDRVLIIEDDPEAATVERTLLEKAGFETKVAATGAAGLELEPQFKPAVVLLDVELPDISGLDVCTSLANSSDAFILMVSAHSSEGDVLKGLGLGADDYIAKPFSGSELVARIQSFLRRRERSHKSDNDGRLAIGSAALVRDFHTLENGGKGVTLTALALVFGRSGRQASHPGADSRTGLERRLRRPDARCRRSRGGTAKEAG
jgi:DNA-binding response OmpR family regulator